MNGGESRYELLGLIGAGGMAEVYRARMIGVVGFEKLVAIKRLLPQVTSDQEFVQRFIDEARLTARLVHPNICQILDFGIMDDCYFLAMEYVDGLDLTGLLKGADRDGEQIPVDVALSIVCGMLRGLKHAHEATDDQCQPLGIVHRDVSPQNVLLSVNGDIKLSDLGAATANAAYRSTRTQKHFRLGKVLYMSPEQRRRQTVDARADLYSTGILLAELLLGQQAFHQDANMFLAGMCCLWDKVADRVAPPLGPELSRVIERALAEDPARRFQTADEMLLTIEGLLLEYAPGSSLDRVARLVSRFKRRKDGKRAPKETDKPEVSSVVSLNTGDLQSLDFPAEQEPAGLSDAVTTIAHGSRSEADPIPAEGQSGEGYVSDEEATLIQRLPPTPDPSLELEPAPEELPGSALSDDPGLLAAPTQPSAARASSTPQQGHEPRRRTVLVAAVAAVAFVLLAGLVFGGLIARRLMPSSEGSSSDELPEDLISTTPMVEPSETADQAAVSPQAPRSEPDAGTNSASTEPEDDEDQRSSRRPSSAGTRPRRGRSRRAARRQEHGYLNINARPYGVPYVDGVQVAPGTPVANHRVSAGRHVVQVHFPQDGRTARRAVEVEPGQTRGVTLSPP